MTATGGTVAPGTGGGASLGTGGSPGVGGAPSTGGTSPVGGAGGSTSGTGGRGMGGASGTGGSPGAGGASGNRKATMVVRGAGTATAGDMVMIGRIVAQGFGPVTVVSDAMVTAQSVVGSDLVVISSSAESAPLQAKLKDIAIPVLCIEDAEFKLMGMSTGGSHTANTTQLSIVPAGAALVGAATGMVTFTSTPGELGWATGTSAATVVIGATMVGNAAQAVIFGYPKGAQMPGGAAPARRAGFAIRETLAAGLNAEGLKLFDAILAWVLQ